MNVNKASQFAGQLTEAYAIRSSNLPKSLALAQHVFQAASQQRDEPSMAQAANLLSLFHAVQCNFDQAIEFANQALILTTKHQDKKGIADAYYNLASVYYRKDNFHLGLEYLLKCLKLYSELKDQHNVARVNKSMGTVYEYFGDYASAEAAYINCIEASQQVNDLNSESNAYNPLSGLLLKKGLFQEAQNMVEQSIRIKQQTNDRRGLGFSLYAKGKVFMANGQHELAITEFRNAIEIHTEHNDLLGVGMAYNKLSKVFFSLGNYIASRETALQANDVALHTGIEFLRFKSYYQLYLICKQEGDLAEAFSYLEKYIQAKEAVINERTRNIIKSYESIAAIESLEKQANAQKEKAEIIERKNDELDSFFYRVSHDLKGPIASLMGLYNLAKMEVKDEAAQQYLSMFNGQTLRINNIVLGLIDLINLRHETSRVKINFAALVDECITSCFYLEKFSTVKIYKEIESGIEFYSEWAIINTILQNLIENAIKYSRSDVAAFVRIKVAVLEGQLNIVVQDNGEGIPENLQGSVFNMFVRGSSRHKGSGLGLYILHRAVERLKGTIAVESKLYEGSTFTVRLPLT